MGLVVAGLDEAGRGALIGPLVVAAYAVEEDHLQLLQALGVRDSKSLSARSRSILFPLLFRLARDVAFKVLEPSTIDEYVRRKGVHRSLNYLEAITMGELLGRIECSKAYIDAPDRNLQRFAQHVRHQPIGSTQLICSHHADRSHPAVAAASIIAKVIRDIYLECLREGLGDLGSGYPSDERTRRMAERWSRRSHHRLPIRRSWKTWRTLLQEKLPLEPRG